MTVLWRSAIFIVHPRLWSDGRRTLIPLVLNIFLVSKMSHRCSSIVEGITATDKDLLSDHNEPFYCGDDLVDSSEDEESTSPAAKRGDDGNYEKKILE